MEIKKKPKQTDNHAIDSRLWTSN